MAIGAAAAGAVAHSLPAISAVPFVRKLALKSLAGQGDSAHVALTFDDGPDRSSTPQILTELDRLGIRATFFMLGSMAEKSGGLAREIFDAGHEVGLHGYEHRNHLFRSGAWVLSDLKRGKAALEDSVGGPIRWFRPPYGVISSGTVFAAHRLDLETVLWSTWGRDWRAKATPETVLTDVLKGIGPGGTILLHDSDCTSSPESWRSTLGALPKIVDAVSQNGWVVGPLRDHAIHSAA